MHTLLRSAFVGIALTATFPAFAADTPKDVAVSIKMADIKAANFQMGLEPGHGSAFGYPRHEVKLKAFKLGIYEITFDQYDAFARATKRALPDDEGWGRGSRPVINVDWADVQAFIAWLNKAGRHFRLPSEAEWEYAAAAGTTTAFWWGDAPKPENGNANTNKAPDTYSFTATVGLFPANPFGLYDMTGNVWEWTGDCRGRNYDSAPADGRADQGPPCDARVTRGGGWNSGAVVGFRPQLRGAAGEIFRSSALGIRLAE